MSSSSISSTELPQIAAPHLLSDLDLTTTELQEVLKLARKVKASPNHYASILKQRYIALVFEKASLRTRVTFEIAIKQLGGDSIYLDHRDGRIGEREPARDMARNLDRWVDAVVARTFEQSTLDDLARWSSVPVINALSGRYHPCQAIADFQTLEEYHGSLSGLKMAFIGDGNNVAHSLMLCAARLGVSLTIATPPGYEPASDISSMASDLAAQTEAIITLTHDPREAAENAVAVYTDIWTSMGWEAETQQRRIAFSDYKVTEELMSHAHPDAIFMHCLPASRGEEVTDNVIESSNSAVFDQAENRLHAQKALLLMLIGSRDKSAKK
ncbi:MAG: ornithine carbamoyltransferase [Solibacterales bacterium]|nr:ornithine carbamoyltransferase [Bryobacterales bacterium]|tara:strand:+ start:25867 stop:26847 length:981 start_codon:yes stop_codon:yes gene_type:complete